MSPHALQQDAVTAIQKLDICCQAAEPDGDGHRDLYQCEDCDKDNRYGQSGQDFHFASSMFLEFAIRPAGPRSGHAAGRAGVW
jgi:hypothetical protein